MTKRKYIQDSDEEDEGEDTPPAKEVKLDRESAHLDSSQRTVADGNSDMKSTGSTGKSVEGCVQYSLAHVRCQLQRGSIGTCKTLTKGY